LGWWHLQIVVNASLKVLVQQGLELLVLLVQETGLFNQILSIDEKGVVLGQGFVKSAPN